MLREIQSGGSTQIVIHHPVPDKGTLAQVTLVVTQVLLVAGHELAEFEPGRYSHYAHRTHLAGSTIEGKAVRAICGVFFVPTQDHEALPICANCQEQYEALPM